MFGEMLFLCCTFCVISLDQDNEHHDKSAAEANNNTNSIVTSYGYILTVEDDEKLSNTLRPASEDCPEDTSTALSASQLEYTVWSGLLHQNIKSFCCEVRTAAMSDFYKMI